jgi:Flp pilus assembly protein TadG
MPALREERGSALVEAAIIIPVLVLILYWSGALTDVLVLKLKASEAARYALFETTVWKTQAQIDQEIRTRFADLRSPAGVAMKSTSLLLYPKSSDLSFQTAVDTTSAEVPLAGGPMATNTGGTIGGFVQQVSGLLASSLQAVFKQQKFNTFGKAQVRVTVGGKRAFDAIVLGGGDLVGARGRNDLGTPSILDKLAFSAPLASARPMQIVFDTWKAWPKPARFTLDGADTNVATDPRRTYPVVERQVEAQVDKIAFFGLRQYSWFQTLDDLGNKVLRSSITSTILGGDLPDIFSTGRMDDPAKRGPITILPQGPTDASFVPNLCDQPGGRTGNCFVQRAGDVRSATDAARTSLDGDQAFTPGEDGTRYTVPYKINTPYWTRAGGADGNDWEHSYTTAMPASIARTNAYVLAWRCRGHYFAGSRVAEEGDVHKRYLSSCP